MPGLAHTGPAAQYPLVGHELAIVFAYRSSARPEARVGTIGGASPLPAFTVKLLERLAIPRRRGV